MKILIMILLLSCVSKAESLNLGLGALTYHGIPTDPDIMERKITSDGKLVYNPEVSLLYTSKEDDLYNVTLLKDCYDKWAGYIGVGGVAERFSDTFSIGVLFGIYARQENGFQDQLALWKVGSLEMSPLPFIYLEKTYPLNKKYELSSILSSNVIISQLLLGLKINL